MKSSIRLFSVAAAALTTFLTAAVTSHAQTPREFAVMVSAAVTVAPSPSIKLTWAKDASQQVVYIWRKAKETARFPADMRDSVVGAGTSWTDTDVRPGEAFEYRLLRYSKKQNGIDSATGKPKFTEWYATGYIHAGIQAAPAPRERALVLVDSTLRSALSSELATFQTDLENEGWDVTIRNVPRAEKFDSNAVKRARAVIKEEWDGGPRDIGSIPTDTPITSAHGLQTGFMVIITVITQTVSQTRRIRAVRRTTMYQVTASMIRVSLVLKLTSPLVVSIFTIFLHSQRASSNFCVPTSRRITSTAQINGMWL
jgi:hypothetical protein